MLLNGILYKKFLKRDGTGEYLQLLVPSALKKDILCQMHNSLLAGHLGRKKTKQKNYTEVLLVQSERGCEPSYSQM